MGIAPDVEQKISAAAVSKGKDLQLEKAVEEALKLLEKEPWPSVTKPPYSTPGKKNYTSYRKINLPTQTLLII